MRANGIGYTAWSWVDWPNLTVDGRNGNYTPTQFGDLLRQALIQQVPSSSGPLPIPGRIEAEDYKAGGEGVAYHDTTSGNSGGTYRSDDVDVEPATDVGGGYNVGWIDPGEWLAFHVEVAQTGDYAITARVASAIAGTKSLHLEVDGVDVTGLLSFTDASGWQSWLDVAVTGVNLTAGQHELRIVMDTDHLNVNYLDITLSQKVNQTPQVDAGLEATVTLPNNAALDGMVSDDGLPNPPGAVSTQWSQVSGPGSVTFGDATAADTTASFSDPGTYVLRLTADDGNLTSSNDVTITVNPANPSPSPLVSNLSVASGKPYELVVDGLISGAPLFIDRSYTFTSIPSSLAGASYIKAANDDKNRSDNSFLSFQVNQGVTVYVAYDHRASSLPNWLRDWNKTGESISTTDVSFNLFSRDFAASSAITLGGNMAAGASGAGSNYFVVLDVAPSVNNAPNTSIVSPQEGAAFLTTDTIQFSGSATDPEDGNLTSTSLVWTSNIDAQIGTGKSAQASLSAGTHVITLTATDSGGASGANTVTITVVNLVYGDADEDSQFTGDDIYLVVDWIIGRKPMPPAGAPAFVAADVNGDRVINITDVELMIARYLNKINRFPVEP
jgi:hypothetical protein